MASFFAIALAVAVVVLVVGVITERAVAVASKSADATDRWAPIIIISGAIGSGGGGGGAFVIITAFVFLFGQQHQATRSDHFFESQKDRMIAFCCVTSNQKLVAIVPQLEGAHSTLL